jgi:hypothetical protein
MKRNRYHHILRFLHFTDTNEPDRKDEISTDLKIQNLFEILYRTFSQFYNHSQHVAFYEVVVLYKVSFSDNTYPRNKRFGIKIYKLCEESGYIYDVKLHVGKNTAKAARLDRNPCDSDREITRTWPQIVYGQRLFFRSAIPRHGHEKHLLLWH